MIRVQAGVNKCTKMYDQIEVCVRNLKALNIDNATYGAILVPFLNGKLPSENRVILSRNFYLKTIFGNWMICLKF